MCKRPTNGGDWPSVSTTPRPVGNCPETYQLFEGHCYKAQTKLFSWSDSSKTCQNETSGGHLVSIKDSKEMAFVTSILGGLGSDLYSHAYWSGLNNINGNGTFTWSDNSQMTYANWAQNNEFYSNVSCG